MWNAISTLCSRRRSEKWDLDVVTHADGDASLGALLAREMNSWLYAHVTAEAAG